MCGDLARQKVPRCVSMRDKIAEYLAKRADLKTRPLVAGPLDDVRQVVVIPALAERDFLFDTLGSLARNPQPDLDKTLIICVVNNRAEPYTDKADIENNRETLALLEGYVRRARTEAVSGAEIECLRLGYIDASSPRNELPPKDGVGLARKLGLDWGAAILGRTRTESPRLLFSLDADTLVEPNYLPAVHAFFSQRHSDWAAVAAYAHRLEGASEEIAAIVCYELFLRYHALGLSYARSPYAFPSIGSTMVCTAEAYAAVSGMNRRQAGEDFYFLEQLAKTGSVARIFTTTVFPSSRRSHRAPFGTGRRVHRFRQRAHDEFRLYHPSSYRILKEWLTLVGSSLERDAAFLLCGAQAIDPLLVAFLKTANFDGTWDRLQQHSRNLRHRRAQFHRWFDGLKTLRLLHFLRDNGYPDQDMSDAIRRLLDMAGAPKCPIPWRTLREDLDSQKALLEHLRWYAERQTPPPC